MIGGLRNLDPALRRAWHPLCRSSEVATSPGRFDLMGERYVAYRLGDGTVRVFLDRCPHRFAPLSLGSCEGDTLRCGYHGWAFGPDGGCREIPALGPDAVVPARAHLSAPSGVVESHGMVFVAPETPLTPRPRVEAAYVSSFQKGDLPVFETRASAGLLADNFLDMAHFPFVHAATFGADQAREVPRFSLQRDGYRFVATHEHDFAHREDPGVEAGIRPLIQRRRLTYRYSAPFHLELAIEFLDAGGTNVIGFFLTPVDDETVRIYSTLWRDDLGDSEERMRDAIDFEVAIVEEDLRLQSRYEVLELPLDVTSELHTRADRSTLELRRILSDLVQAHRDESGDALAHVELID
jgi:phenylpropionate dioxygenase-like ring-hydroxylating dioxygenase large terminal subunit